MPESKRDATDLKGKTGPKRMLNAFIYSKQGFVSAWKTEEAFRQEILLAAVMIPAACLIPVTLTHKLLMIITVMLVLIVEVLNSAIEAVVDRFGNEIHPLSGKAKDLGSLAVLLSLFVCGGTWVAVLCDAFL